MNEMQLLEEFRAVVAPPDPGTLAQARARVLAGAAAGQASRRARWPRLPGRWPKLALTGLAAAATATAVAVALAAPGGTPSHPGAASPIARELAYRVADVAAAPAGRAPRPVGVLAGKVSRTPCAAGERDSPVVEHGGRDPDRVAVQQQGRGAYLALPLQPVTSARWLQAADVPDDRRASGGHSTNLR